MPGRSTLPPADIRAALDRAHREIRLNYTGIVALAALQALFIGLIIRLTDFADALHVLLVLIVALLWVQILFLALVLTARNDAVNSRLLRALELIDERLNASLRQ